MPNASLVTITFEADIDSRGRRATDPAGPAARWVFADPPHGCPPQHGLSSTRAGYAHSTKPTKRMINIEPHPGTAATSGLPASGDRRSTVSPMRSLERATPAASSEPDQTLAVVSPSLPLLVLSLPDRAVRAANGAAVDFFGMSRQELSSRTLNAVIVRTESEMIGQALSALGSGAIDSYRAHRTFETAHGPVLGVVWVRSIPRASGGMALALVLPAEETDDPAASSAGQATFDLAAGTMSSAGRIKTLSRADSGVLAGRVDGSIAAPSLAGHVHPDDRGRFQSALEQVDPDLGDVIVPIRVDHELHEWVPIECHLFPTGDDATGEPVGFVLSEPARQHAAVSAARIAQLEQHINRIAAEVRAAGMAMGLTGHAGAPRSFDLGALTPRQRAIVVRLLEGARVSTIAAALYISPSTVRNHLSSVYRMAHVHSQAELIELLRPTG